MIKVLISPGKYVQGPGALLEIEKHLANLGDNALVIVDSFLLPESKKYFGQDNKEFRFTVEKFGGECSKPEIERLKQIAIQMGANIIVGFGGGKTLDTAKAVAHFTNLPVVILPSIASTDAPCSALSVIYKETGEFDEYLILPKNPEIVLVDSNVVVQAPVRFLVAGMGDALATKFEAEASSKRSSVTMAGGRPSISALALADLCLETLLEFGYAALLAAEKKVITPAVEKIIEANIFLSGIGFESGGLGAAHAIHNGFTVLEETHEYYHGEKVAFSTLVQLVMEDRPTEEIITITRFCKMVGLPVTLKELGLDGIDAEKLMQVATTATAEGETIHNMPFPVNAQMVFDSIIAADAIGQNLTTG
jgi:glycerol dehydrogenase